MTVPGTAWNHAVHQRCSNRNITDFTLTLYKMQVNSLQDGIFYHDEKNYE